VLTLVLFKSPKLDKIVEGTETVLIRHGVLDQAAMKKEALTELELKSVLHKQGLNDYSEVEKCVLEPNGTFYVEGKTPSSDDAQRKEVLDLVRSLSIEVRELKVLLAARG
jgi:uncharacterized membrane protein YcaP (DUF421 family)